MSNAMSLKARIRNIAKRINLPAQMVLRNYMLERLLLRLSKSGRKNEFVVKGGMLVAAVVGLANRTTMDLDATLRNLPLEQDAIEKAFKEICAIPDEDGVVYSFNSIKPIRKDDFYGGFRVSVIAKYDTLTVPLTIDITTGDAITPGPAPFRFNELLFPEKSFELWAYNIETVLAEKVETILRRSEGSTRPRDYYDIYILAATQEYDKGVFADALSATARHRGTEQALADREATIKRISGSEHLRRQWDKYRGQFAYAKNIEFDALVGALVGLVGLAGTQRS